MPEPQHQTVPISGKEPTQAEQEAAFRDSLRDVIVILKTNAPFYMTVDDLIDTLELALDNDGLLRLLLDKATKRPKR